MTATLTSRTTSTTPDAPGTSITQVPAWFVRMRRGSLALSTVTIGLAAGFFFTYQISVIRGLARVDDAAYVATFQAINETIRNAPFGIVFFGSIPILVATLALHWNAGGLRRSLIGASLGLYLATFAVTAIGNVPLNDDLGAVTDRSAAALAAARADFEGSWNTLNLVRTLTCVGALVAIALVGRLGRNDHS